jgi:hypothetical protein
MPGGPTDPKLIGFPQFVISGYGALGPTFQPPTNFTVNSFDISDTLTWVKGPHMIKLGASILRTQYFELVASNSRGTYQFTGVWTGTCF